LSQWRTRRRRLITGALIKAHRLLWGVQGNRRAGIDAAALDAAQGPRVQVQSCGMENS